MHAHLVQIVVGLSLLQAEGLPQLGWEAGQQLIENMIISLVFGLQGRQEARWAHKKVVPSVTQPGSAVHIETCPCTGTCKLAGISGGEI